MRLFVCSVLAGALGFSGAASAQVGKLYMQDALPYNIYNNQVYVAQGGTINQTLNLNGPYEHNLTVAGGEIRTYGGASYGQPGYNYDLNGSFLGQQYNANGTYQQDIYYGPDAATDGKYNYVNDYGWGYVMRFDRNWQNGTVLFGQGGYGGITVDRNDGNLWILDTWGQTIKKTDMSGNVITSFSDGNLYNQYLALAMDVDGTLWALQGNGMGNGWRQYDTSGNLLSTGNFPGGSFNIGSAEFDWNAVPAPGSAALLGLGGLVASRRRRA